MAKSHNIYHVDWKLLVNFTKNQTVTAASSRTKCVHISSRWWRTSP